MIPRSIRKWSAIAWSGSGLIAFSVVAPLCQSQQPAAWSPDAFVAPQTTQSVQNIPRNSLRESVPKESGEVARWRAPESMPVTDNKNFSTAIPTRTPTTIQATNASIVASPAVRPTEPRSSFELNEVMQREASKSAKSHVRLASHATESNATSANRSTSNGVWYDRADETAESGLQIGPPILMDSTSRRASQLKSNAPSESSTSTVRRVRHQEPKTDSPLGIGPLNLPPPQTSLPEPIPSVLATPESLRSPDRSLNAEPPRMQDPSSRPGQSLLDKEPVVPNPFPSSRNPSSQDSRSPSDGSEPLPLNRADNKDKAPAPPRSAVRSTVDCDVVRQMAKDTDIRKIKVDSSPIFGASIQDEKSKPKNTKEDFVANAPTRNWYNHDGAVVAQGKLVDIEYGMVIIEREDGTRTSYLMRKLSDYDQAYVAQSWSIPITCSIDDGSFPSRDFVETTMTWKASGACHKPLYFEDVQLERYGHEWGPAAQPVVSTLRFFGGVAVLPYKMGIHPMNECQYALGHYRPGSCAPWTIGPVPLSLQGALMQAKFVTGTALAMP
ncbi:MAG: hypothetical protein ABL921_00045 [Pirellula sp.]